MLGYPYASYTTISLSGVLMLLRITMELDMVNTPFVCIDSP